MNAGLKLFQSFFPENILISDIEDYCNRNIEIANFFSDNPDAGYTFMKGLMISYRKKANTST